MRLPFSSWGLAAGRDVISDALVDVKLELLVDVVVVMHVCSSASERSQRTFITMKVRSSYCSASRIQSFISWESRR